MNKKPIKKVKLEPIKKVEEVKVIVDCKCTNRSIENGKEVCKDCGKQWN
jgi:hypothetical protein